MLTDLSGTEVRLPKREFLCGVDMMFSPTFKELLLFCYLCGGICRHSSLGPLTPCLHVDVFVRPSGVVTPCKETSAQGLADPSLGSGSHRRLDIAQAASTEHRRAQAYSSWSPKPPSSGEGRFLQHFPLANLTAKSCFYPWVNEPQRRSGRRQGSLYHI